MKVHLYVSALSLCVSLVNRILCARNSEILALLIIYYWYTKRINYYVSQLLMSNDELDNNKLSLE